MYNYVFYWHTRSLFTIHCMKLTFNTSLRKCNVGISLFNTSLERGEQSIAPRRRSLVRTGTVSADIAPVSSIYSRETVPNIRACVTIIQGDVTTLTRSSPPPN
eukprot:GFUD01000142.1.p1 GENE.GFUD01000142.1~~GFUD01000142.1.p1  ORF type:complete len:103 (+),score=3.99 GFUD01000142.1:124-432(+)